MCQDSVEGEGCSPGYDHLVLGQRGKHLLDDARDEVAVAVCLLEQGEVEVEGGWGNIRNRTKRASKGRWEMRRGEGVK